jgi:DNA-binding MarR family transcriptional regulator
MRKASNVRHSIGTIPSNLLERHSKAYPEFEPDAAQVVFSIRALATSINDASSEWLLPSGLNPAKMNVILILEGIPEGLPLSALGALLHTRSPHVTALVDSMEADGLVCRQPNPEDRRSVIARLTPKGRRLFQKMFVTHCRGNSSLVTTLSRAERSTLVSLLAKLYVNVEAVRANEQHARRLKR